MKVRRCGCIFYVYGPAILCETHEEKLLESEEKGLRKLVHDQAGTHGHKLNKFLKYNVPHTGKWTAYCEYCSLLVIIYDDIPTTGGDQILGRPLTEECHG